MPMRLNACNLGLITIAYGKETSSISFQSDVNDPVDVRVSTVGRIQPHCEVKIVKDDDYDVGQKGYWNDGGHSIFYRKRIVVIIDNEGFVGYFSH